MPEKLVNGGGHLPPNQHYVVITIPSGISYKMFAPRRGTGLVFTTGVTSKAHGDLWLQQNRSLLLIVPSVVACVENNFLLNPAHPKFPKVTSNLHHPIWWDSRLFAA